MIRTPFTELTGVRHPVVRTGMGWVAGPRLVTATARAGALGILASATMSTERLREAVREVKSRTDAPFGVCARTPVATTVLLPQVVDAVDIPVIAAGGFHEPGLGALPQQLPRPPRCGPAHPARYPVADKASMVDGRTDLGVTAAGQVAGVIGDVPTCAEPAAPPAEGVTAVMTG